ncbi:MAG: hypothetical protein KDK65_02150 [Chlamydiia bacterium]|nr:hypothetical protein [Chlamydiia bacterium]
MSVQVDSRPPATIATPGESWLHAAINRHFDPGQTFDAIGQPKTTGVAELDHLGAKRLAVKSDGVCWARATWQSTFGQILDDQHAFDAVVDQIAHPLPGYQIPDTLAQNTVHILYKLKSLSPEGRIHYLNHKNVDDTLIFYMRHVAGEYMSKNFSTYSAADIAAIKSQKTRWGGPESVAFTKYFHLENHTITKYRGEWAYKKQSDPKHYPLSKIDTQKHSMPALCLFGVSESHFEVLSFPQQAPKTQPKVDLNRACDQLAEQIEKDFAYAKELQAQFDADVAAERQQVARDREMAVMQQQMLVVKKGSQQNCTGPVNKKSVENRIHALNHTPTPGVRFNPQQAVSHLTGGTCSAMAFTFLHEALKGTPLSQIPVDTSNETHRTLQAAYNAIERDPKSKTADFHRAKIDAMLKQFHITTTGAYDHPDLASLPEGTYVVRQLTPAANSKGEERGHSMILIKKATEFVLYDPNNGIEQNHTAASAQAVLDASAKKWNTPLSCLYPVQRATATAPTPIAKAPKSPVRKPVRKPAVKPQPLHSTPTKKSGWLSPLFSLVSTVLTFLWKGLNLFTNPTPPKKQREAVTSESDFF